MWGLGKCNGEKLDNKTGTKVDGDMGVLVKEAGMREKSLPNVWFVWSEHFKFLSLKTCLSSMAGLTASRAKTLFVMMSAGATSFVLPISAEGLVVLA